jgi:sulfonate transport system substrate-binding protein
MPRRKLGLIALAGALAGGLAACSAGATATTTSATSGVVINLGDQEQDLQTLLTASGALKGADYTVNFDEFDSGPLVDAGFAAHKIDVGFMGDLPASLAVKSGLPVVAIAVTEPVGADEYLLAQPGITSIAQLKGKPVAYTTGTAEEAFALRALKTAGLNNATVHQVNVTLDQLGTVLQSGSAVASVVSAEQMADYDADHPGSKVLATDVSVQPPSYDYTLATKAALANPAKAKAIADLTRRLIEASNWQRAHESQWVTDYYVDVEHQTPAIAKVILAAGGTEIYVPLTSAVRSALQDMVDIMAAGGGLSSSFSVSPLYDASASARYNAVVKAVPQHG